MNYADGHPMHGIEQALNGFRRGAEPAPAVRPVDCSSCAALCCRSTVRMPLTEAEAGFMAAGGTALQQVPDTHRRRLSLPIIGIRHPATDEYSLQTDCGHLTEDAATGQMLCSSYDDPGRPEVCREFLPGSYRCRELRSLGGIDTSAEFAAYVAATERGAQRAA